MDERVVIIGAGLAGLACACELKAKGIDTQIFEASDRVGGRVQTDRQDGFLLDRGFQVLLTAYPQTARLLNYKDLQLANFNAGARIRSRGTWLKVADPTREPAQLLSTAFAPIGSLADRLRILKLRQRVTVPSLEQMLDRPEITTAARLDDLGFSEAMVRQFFRPFLGGIFLETGLTTSSRKFEFVFRMFSQGFAALPAKGMAAIPEQLTSRLSPGQIQFKKEVVAITQTGVRLTTGEEIPARCVVIATDLWTAERLRQRPYTLAPATAVCLYFAAPKSPVDGAWLVLNGEGAGPVNNLCVLTELQRSYAPAGQSLISVTVLDQQYQRRDDLEATVRSQLAEWFGPAVSGWRTLKQYRIENAVPIQVSGALSEVQKPVRLAEGLLWCGDHTGIVSIEGAIESGLRAAAAIAG